MVFWPIEDDELGLIKGTGTVIRLYFLVAIIEFRY